MICQCIGYSFSIVWSTLNEMHRPISMPMAVQSKLCTGRREVYRAIKEPNDPVVELTRAKCRTQVASIYALRYAIT